MTVATRPSVSWKPGSSAAGGRLDGVASRSSATSFLSRRSLYCGWTATPTTLMSSPPASLRLRRPSATPSFAAFSTTPFSTTQCAAVMTTRGAIRVPPQNWRCSPLSSGRAVRLWPTAAIHGHWDGCGM